MLAPIMAKATTAQLDLRPPTKNPALSAPRAAIHEMVNNTIKYAAMVMVAISGDICIEL